VKLEPPGGELSRPVGLSFFLSNNANKRSVVIDTHKEDGATAVRRLASEANVLVSNLRQGALERMGLSSEDLKSLNPSIVESRITAFGWDGPYERRPGLDPLAQAMIGLLRDQGGRDSPPMFLGQIAPSDYAAGAMGALGAVMALYVWERTGRGQRIDTNLLDGSIVVSSEVFNRYRGRPPRRIATRDQLGLSPLHRAYETRDGWLYLDAEAESGWNALRDVLGANRGVDGRRFSAAGQRGPSAEDLAVDVEAIFRTADTATWLRRLESSGILCAPIVDTDDGVFFSDPQAIAADKIVEYDHPVLGRMQHSDGMLEFGDTRAAAGRPAPLLGQHTGEVLVEVGYSHEEVADMVHASAVMLEHTRESSRGRCN
jgi:crotonobetainyl-CoA:carnitine CoA-transferase CaiB-like acyl-CoA transferase